MSIDAPAKINLGLEILGRRDDGFHDIKTVLATISLRDTLVFKDAEGPGDELRIEPGGLLEPTGPNLILSALTSLRHVGLDIPPQHIKLTKRIPVAAGLGGASSDAAATLKYFSGQHSIPASDVVRIGAKLGSDVPFFLDAPFALAQGRGEVLSALPSPTERTWVVIVTPDLRIPAKTATMYRAIERNWWSTGSEVDQFAARFPDIAGEVPANVFARPLFSRYPEIVDIRDQLLRLGFPTVMVTGAGPTMFTIVGSHAHAANLARRAKAALPSTVVLPSWLGYSAEHNESQFDLGQR